MTLYADIPGVAIQVSRNIVVASIRRDNPAVNDFRTPGPNSPAVSVANQI